MDDELEVGEECMRLLMELLRALRCGLGCRQWFVKHEGWLMGCSSPAFVEAARARVLETSSIRIEIRRLCWRVLLWGSPVKDGRCLG